MQFVDPGFLCELMDDVPDNLFSHALTPNSNSPVHATKDPARGESCCIQPVIKNLLGPVRHRRRPRVTSLSHEIDLKPQASNTAKVIAAGGGRTIITYAKGQAEAAEIVHAAGGLLHVDAIQALGKIPFDIKGLNADLITISGHKIGGPKGVGAVVLAEGVRGLEPLLRGGGQELGRRAGTENVAGIAGFGAAMRAAMDSLENDAIRIENLRNRLEKGLRQASGAIVFSGEVPRLPNTTLFTVPGMRAEKYGRIIRAANIQVE
jgi:selenocysteine lyase/cysteine desulfurase